MVRQRDVEKGDENGIDKEKERESNTRVCCALRNESICSAPKSYADLYFGGACAVATVAFVFSSTSGVIDSRAVLSLSFLVCLSYTQNSRNRHTHRRYKRLPCFLSSI